MRFLFYFFCVVIICCTFIGCSISDTPKSVAKKYYEAISIKGNINDVMKLMDLPDESDKRKSGMEDMIRRKMNAEIEQQKEWSKENGGIDSINVDEVKKGKRDDKDYAIVILTIKYKNGSKNCDSVDVIKTDKGWKATL